MIDIRYPIGRFTFESNLTQELNLRHVEQIAKAPDELRRSVSGLTSEQIDTAYRPAGWTIRQVVHHVPDSHLHSYVRFKMALTESEPSIMTYKEDKWAELADTRATPLEVSLALLQALHLRWVVLLRSLDASDFARTFRHPELGIVRLDQAAALYAWHGRHHVAHITALRDRMNWC